MGCLCSKPVDKAEDGQTVVQAAHKSAPANVHAIDTGNDAKDGASPGGEEKGTEGQSQKSPPEGTDGVAKTGCSPSVGDEGKANDVALANGTAEHTLLVEELLPRAAVDVEQASFMREPTVTPCVPQHTVAEAVRKADEVINAPRNVAMEGPAIQNRLILQDGLPAPETAPKAQHDSVWAEPIMPDQPSSLQPAAGVVDGTTISVTERKEALAEAFSTTEASGTEAIATGAVNAMDAAMGLEADGTGVVSRCQTDATLEANNTTIDPVNNEQARVAKEIAPPVGTAAGILEAEACSATSTPSLSLDEQPSADTITKVPASSDMVMIKPLAEVIEMDFGSVGKLVAEQSMATQPAVTESIAIMSVSSPMSPSSTAPQNEGPVSMSTVAAAVLAGKEALESAAARSATEEPQEQASGTDAGAHILDAVQVGTVEGNLHAYVPSPSGDHQVLTSVSFVPEVAGVDGTEVEAAAPVTSAASAPSTAGAVAMVDSAEGASAAESTSLQASQDCAGAVVSASYETSSSTAAASYEDTARSELHEPQTSESPPVPTAPEASTGSSPRTGVVAATAAALMSTSFPSSPSAPRAQQGSRVSSVGTAAEGGSPREAVLASLQAACAEVLTAKATTADGVRAARAVAVHKSLTGIGPEGPNGSKPTSPPPSIDGNVTATSGGAEPVLDASAYARKNPVPSNPIAYMPASPALPDSAAAPAAPSTSHPAEDAIATSGLEGPAPRNVHAGSVDDKTGCGVSTRPALTDTPSDGPGASDTIKSVNVPPGDSAAAPAVAAGSTGAAAVPKLLLPPPAWVRTGVSFAAIAAAAANTNKTSSRTSAPSPRNAARQAPASATVVAPVAHSDTVGSGGAVAGTTVAVSTTAAAAAAAVEPVLANKADIAPAAEAAAAALAAGAHAAREDAPETLSRGSSVGGVSAVVSGKNCSDGAASDGSGGSGGGVVGWNKQRSFAEIVALAATAASNAGQSSAAGEQKRRSGTDSTPGKPPRKMAGGSGSSSPKHRSNCAGKVHNGNEGIRSNASKEGTPDESKAHSINSLAADALKVASTMAATSAAGMPVLVAVGAGSRRGSSGGMAGSEAGATSTATSCSAFVLAPAEAPKPPLPPTSSQAPKPRRRNQKAPSEPAPAPDTVAVSESVSAGAAGTGVNWADEVEAEQETVTSSAALVTAAAGAKEGEELPQPQTSTPGPVVPAPARSWASLLKRPDDPKRNVAPGTGTEPVGPSTQNHDRRRGSRPGTGSLVGTPRVPSDGSSGDAVAAAAAKTAPAVPAENGATQNSADVAVVGGEVAPCDASVRATPAGGDASFIEGDGGGWVEAARRKKNWSPEYPGQGGGFGDKGGRTRASHGEGRNGGRGSRRTRKGQ